MFVGVEASPNLQNKRLARLWFFTLGSLMLSAGPAIFVSMLSMAPEKAVHTLSDRPFEVLMAQDHAQSAQMERTLLWASSTVGLLFYVVACAYAFVCFRNKGSQRLHGIVAGLLILTMLMYAFECIGKPAHLMQSVI